MTGQIDELERETEQARTALASSLDALTDRLTPDEVVEEALDYARETRVGQVALAAREVGGPAGDPMSGVSTTQTGRVSGGREDFWPIVAIEGAQMGQKSGPVKEPAEQVVKEIRRATRRQFSAEEKIRIVLTGLRGEDSIAELCRREGIVQNLYYRWSKEFLEAGKKRLAGDTERAATSSEVKDLRREAGALKEVVAELMLENRLLKKSTIGAGEDGI